VTEHEDVSDLVIIGAGVMGLFTAYHASARAGRIVVLERGRVGDPTTASYGRTRSFRNDYLDATYARLAQESYRLWGEFERETSAKVLIRCGCLNIAQSAITPDLDSSYAQLSYEVLQRLRFQTDSFDAEQVQQRFPYLRADIARLDVDAGVVNLPAVTEALTRVLRERGVSIIEEVQTTAISSADGVLTVSADAATFGAVTFRARALVVTAGHGANDVLAKLPGCQLQLPITKDRPSEAKYLDPPPNIRAQFLSDVMPVIAYLDTGIYCHPIVPGLSESVKIGYYNPPDMPRSNTMIDSIGRFVEQCIPSLVGASVRDVEDVDQCDYDLVADDDFVLGAIPGVPNAFVGVGWRGTGYKFAPWVGRVLAELATQAGTVYNIDRFDPARFDGGTISR
jgi:sarcosine oxidase